MPCKLILVGKKPLELNVRSLPVVSIALGGSS